MKPCPPLPAIDRNRSPPVPLLPMMKRLLVIFGCAAVAGHAGESVEDEIRRSVQDPCGSGLEYLATVETRHLGCPGCASLSFRGPEMAEGLMRYFNAIAESGASKNGMRTFMSVMGAVEMAAGRRLAAGEAGPVSIAEQARQSGLCRQD